MIVNESLGLLIKTSIDTGTGYMIFNDLYQFKFYSYWEMFTVLYILPYDVKCDIKHQTKHYYQNDVNLNSKPVIRYVIFIGFCRPCNCCKK